MRKWRCALHLASPSATRHALWYGKQSERVFVVVSKHFSGDRRSGCFVVVVFRVREE